MTREKIVESAGKRKRKNIPFRLDKKEFLSLVERTTNAVYAAMVEVEQIPAKEGMDSYELSDKEGRILIKATSGVAAACAFNKYLRTCCSYTVGAMMNAGSLPDVPPKIGDTIKKQSSFHYRYLFNYCTFGYTYAFYGWEAWEKVLDWALLSGYNLVLNPIAQETIWYKLLMEIGYSSREAKDFLVGPAHMPWLLMMNMSGFAGDYPDSWFKERAELAVKFNKRLEAFGASAVIPGYAGMVPDDFGNRFKESKPVDQGLWNGIKRPAYILPQDAMFDKVSTSFYHLEKEILGAEKVHYYSADPFHEGIVPENGSINLEEYAKGVFTAMHEQDEDAVWVFQGWGDNPSRKLLNSLEPERVLITNLCSLKNFNGGDEFGNSPWIFCTIQNFGGQHMMRGNLKGALVRPFDGGKSNTMVGVGIAPEAIETDEVLFDMLAEINFEQEAPNYEEYLGDFVKRRYGTCQQELVDAWKILAEEIYIRETPPELNESALCCRPSLTADRVCTWGEHAEIKDGRALTKVIKLLLSQYEICKESETYRYDLVDFSRQLMGDDSWKLVYGIQEAYAEKDVDTFRKMADKFLARFDLAEALLSSHEKCLLGNWLEPAKRLGKTELEKRWFEWNARILITVWSCKAGELLHDYAAREYAGMIKDFYKPRWERFISMAEISLFNGKPIPEYDNYDLESAFAYERGTYPTKAQGDVRELVERVLSEIEG